MLFESMTKHHTFFVRPRCVERLPGGVLIDAHLDVSNNYGKFQFHLWYGAMIHKMIVEKGGA
jgi:hypothetical protein